MVALRLSRIQLGGAAVAGLVAFAALVHYNAIGFLLLARAPRLGRA